MELSCFFDFTCEYSYRVWTWFERMRAAGTELEVDWRPFVLKEVNREDAEASVLTGPSIDSVAVLALAAAEALRGETGAENYRAEVFHAMHAGDDRPLRDDIVEMAARAGLDTDSFWRDETLWLGSVRASHEGAVAARKIFGTPTLVFGDNSALYLKLRDLPPAAHDPVLWDSVTTFATEFPEVVELKRPSPE